MALEPRRRPWHQLGDVNAAHLWWPEDHTWFIHTDTDLGNTYYFDRPEELTEALLTDPRPRPPESSPATGWSVEHPPHPRPHTVAAAS